MFNWAVDRSSVGFAMQGEIKLVVRRTVLARRKGAKRGRASSYRTGMGENMQGLPQRSWPSSQNDSMSTDFGTFSKTPDGARNCNPAPIPNPHNVQS